MKRWAAVFLLLCMLAGLTSVCTSSGGDERTEPHTAGVSASPQSYTETKDGVTLRVTVQNSVCRPGDTVEVEAVVTNASGKEIQYYLPTTTNNMHFEITVEIKKERFFFCGSGCLSKTDECRGRSRPPCTRRFLHPEDEVLCRVGKRGYRRRLGEGGKNACLPRPGAMRAQPCSGGIIKRT